jgi:hypothetical protein
MDWYTNNTLRMSLAAATPTLTLGVAGSTKGIFNLTGNTSGTVSIQGAAAAGTWSLTLPTTGGTNKYLLQTDGTGISTWSQVDLTAAVTGDLPFANLAQIVGLSVLGVTGSSTADVAAITAGSDNQVFRRSGSSLGFGSILLSSGSAVTGTLGMSNGGTGSNSLSGSNALIYISGSAFAALAAGATSVPVWNNSSNITKVAGTVSNRLLRTDGTTISFAQVALTTDVTGVLPEGNGGTGVAKSSLFDHFTDANNGTTVETDLYSDTLTAGQFATNGQKVRAHYQGIFTGAAAATQQIKVYFGGTAIYNSGALSIGVATNYWTVNVVIIRVSSSVVRCSVWVNSDFATLFPYSKYTEVTGLTLSNSQVLKITGTAAGAGGASNQITATEGYVTFITNA